MAVDFKRAVRNMREGKAITPHPALTGRDQVATYVPGAANPQDGRPRIAQREAPRHLQAYGGQKDAIDWVMDCVRLYADAAAGADFLFRQNGERVWLERTAETPKDAKVRAEPLLANLFDAPNPFMGWESLVEHFVIDILLVGNAYWYKYQTTSDGRPLALYRLSPAHVKAVPGKFGIEQYDYQPPGVADSDKLEIQPENMLHFKMPNPHNAYYGMGLVQGGARALDLELALTDAQASYYENKAEPSLIVQSERRVPRDVFNKLRAQLRGRMSGTNKTGELLVLEAGLTASTLSTNARDALYAEMSGLSRDRIFTMFRASPKLFGITDAAGSDKITDARREFDTYVIQPFLKKMAKQITRGLTNLWDIEFQFDYNYVIPAEDLVKLSGDFASIPGVKVREVRRFLMPTGILDGESTGDEEIDDMILNLPGEELDEDGQGGFPDRPLPGEPGRPPLGENTRAFPKVRQPAGKALTWEEEWKAVSLNPPAPITVGNKLPREQRPPDAMESDRDAAIDAAAQSAMDGLKRAALTLERGLLDHVEGKALGGVDKRIRTSQSWRTFTRLLEEAMEPLARRAASTAAVHQSGLGRNPETDLDYDALAKQIVHRPEGVLGITSTLRERVLKYVDEAEETREATERAVREAIMVWNDSNRETIALDTAVKAYNMGTIGVIEATGGRLLVLDGRDHDQPCIDADGTIMDPDEARANLQQHPRCRRAFIGVD